MNIASSRSTLAYAMEVHVDRLPFAPLIKPLAYIVTGTRFLRMKMSTADLHRSPMSRATERATNKTLLFYVVLLQHRKTPHAEELSVT